MTITPVQPDAAVTDAARRHAEAIAGLAAAAEFLAAHPGLPLCPYGNPLSVSIRAGSDEDQRAEVDRIAGILGTTAGYIHGSRTHYAAYLHFGGGVTYSATAISGRYMDRYEAHMTKFRTGAGVRAAA